MRKILLVLLMASQNCIAQQTISDFLSVPFPSQLEGSTDGKLIAWVFNDQGARNIFIAEAPAFNAKQLTSYSGDDGMDISELMFTPDGRSLLFVRGNSPNSNGETANPAQLQVSTERVIWKVRINSEALQQISKGAGLVISPDSKQVVFRSAGQAWIASLIDSSKPKQLFTMRGSPSQFRWSPDGNTIAFVSNRGDHSYIGLYSLLNKTVTFPDPTIDLQSQPVWSADGRSLAYINVPNAHNRLMFTAVRSGNPWSIRLLDLNNSMAKEIWKASPGKGSILFDDLPVADNLLWWAANDQLIFPYEKDGWQHLYALDMKAGTTKLLTPGDGEIENVVMSPNRQTIFYTTNINDINRRHIWQLDMNGGSPRQVTTGVGIEWSPVLTSEGLALLHSGATIPAWPATYKNGELKDIASEKIPDRFPKTLSTPQAITITAKDGLRFTADLFLPPGYQPGKKYPAVIFFHGGSRRQMVLGFHYSQYYSNAYALNEFFASQGYIALSVNYRSGIGYGMEFREALRYGAGGASEVQDVVASGEYLRNRKDIAGDKIALWGGSYGGYLTAHGLAQASNLFACGVDIHGVHNWNDEIPIFTDWYDYAKFPAMAKTALESSPVHFVKGWRSPVLLVHGDDDRNVYFSESVNIAEQLRAQQVPVEQLILPDEVHFFLLHRNWVKTFETAFDFVERRLGRK